MGNEDEALERDLRALLTTTDPVAAVAEQDALRAVRDFPLLVMVGPMFGIAEEHPGGWQIVSLGEATPQCSRDELAAHLRLLAVDAPDPTEYLAGASLLDWERHDELVVAGRRFRIIRVEQVIRMNTGEPEPPRPTDLDPRRGHTRPPEFLSGTASAEEIRQFDEAIRRPGFMPEDMVADAVKAMTHHPMPVPLCPAFSVAEYLHDGWRSATAACPTPQLARESLAAYFQHMLPAIEQPSPDLRAEYALAGRVLTEARLNELEVAGRRFRILRLEMVARLGPDGPEPPRPSDFDPDPPVEILAVQLRAEGLLED
jgi:hypothetical protein